MQFAATISTKNSNKAALKERSVTVGQSEMLSKRNAELEAAIKTVLRYISSNQVYDKDARGILLRALGVKIKI